MSEILAPAILAPLEPIRALGLYHVPDGWRGAVVAPVRERWLPRLGAAGVGPPSAGGSAAAGPAPAVVGECRPGLHLFVRGGGRHFRCYRVAVWQPVFVPAGDPATPNGHLEVWLRLDDLAVALALPDPVSGLVARVAARLGAVPTETLAGARDPSALAAVVGRPAALAEGLGLEVRLVAFHQATAEASTGPQAAAPPPEPYVAGGERARTAAGDSDALLGAERLERERAILVERGYPPLARLDRLPDGSEVLRLDLAGQPNLSVFFVVPSAYPAESAYLVTASHIGADEAARREAPRGVSLAALAAAAVERGVLGRLKQRLGGRG